MNGNNYNSPDARDLDLANAKLAYTIVESLLQHNTVLTDLIALMAQVLDEDTQRALTNTPQWKAYLDSRRALDNTRAQIDKFTVELKRLEGLQSQK